MSLSSYDYQLIADALDILDPDSIAATTRKQELENWARQMAATGKGYLPGKARVVVGLEGGCVQGASADVEGIELIILDYDTESADDDDITLVPQSGKSETVEACTSAHDAELDPKWVSQIASMVLAN